jgi:hypothetical protein
MRGSDPSRQSCRGVLFFACDVGRDKRRRHLLKKALDAVRKGRALIRQLNAAPLARKEFYSEFGFQRLNGESDGGLRHMERVRRRIHCAARGDGVEDAQAAERQRFTFGLLGHLPHLAKSYTACMPFYE